MQVVGSPPKNMLINNKTMILLPNSIIPKTALHVFMAPWKKKRTQAAQRQGTPVMK